MVLKRSITTVLWLLLVSIVVATVAFLAFTGCLATHYWWDRDQWNQERIAKAYIAFYQNRMTFPSSLADLVKAGYLPQRAEWYKEPPGLFTHAIDFKESCYVVMVPKSGNVDNLDMLGRRIHRDEKEEIDFSPPINAEIRDAIKGFALTLGTNQTKRITP